jgi:hypothetical protein
MIPETSTSTRRAPESQGKQAKRRPELGGISETRTTGNFSVNRGGGQAELDEA